MRSIGLAVLCKNLLSLIKANVIGRKTSCEEGVVSSWSLNSTPLIYFLLRGTHRLLLCRHFNILAERQTLSPSLCNCHTIKTRLEVSHMILLKAHR